MRIRDKLKSFVFEIKLAAPGEAGKTNTGGGGRCEEGLGSAIYRSHRTDARKGSLEASSRSNDKDKPTRTR